MSRAAAYAVAALVAAAITLLAGRASAHAIGLSNGDYTADGEVVSARLALSRGELRDGADPLAQAASLAALVAVTAGERPCPITTPPRAEAIEGDGVSVTLGFTCERGPGRVRVDLGRLLDGLPSGHRHLARGGRAGAPPADRVLWGRDAAFDLGEATGEASPPTAPGTSAGALEFLRMGVEHILTGYDHLVFLLGLILVGGRFRSTLATISAFTIAHSITLGAAALGLFAPSPRIVEPLIALSIVYVGIENLFVKSTAGRWRVTLPFGLVHGFGFAGALAEIEIPRARVPLALISFNAGVELGQLAVVGVALVAWRLLSRGRSVSPPVRALGVRVASGVVIALGGVWLVLRVIGV